jgi:hypothetical protein
MAGACYHPCMVRLGMGALLTAVVAFVLGGGCRAEKFVSPDKPDLYKVPYDFGDLVGADLASADQSAAAVDLASPDDLKHGDHD